MNSHTRKASIALFFGACVLVSHTACTWRQVGCASGGIAARAAASAILSAITSKKGINISKEQKEAILAIATVLGCIIGSKIAGNLETYVKKKREEYANEAAYLQAHIQDLNTSISRADKNIAWLESQNTTLKTQANEIRKLPDPAVKEYLGGKFKEAATQRKNDAEKIEQYLKDEKEDMKEAIRTTSDNEKKEELRARIIELDKRIESTRNLRNELLKTSAQVSYV